MTLSLLFHLFLFFQSPPTNPVVILNTGSGGGGTGNSGTISNISVISSTPTAVRFTANYTGTSPVGIGISKTSDFAEMVPDVDGGKFAGSNLSTSHCSLTAGLLDCVVGKRTAEAGVGGIFYSHALAASTHYYGRLTAPGQSPQTFPFDTANIANDLGYLEAQVPAANGYLAHPSIASGDRNQTFTDPQTGAEFKRLTLSSDVSNTSGASVTVNAPSPWTSSNGTYTVSGSQAAAFVRLTNGDTEFDPAHPDNPYVNPDQNECCGSPRGAYGTFQLVLNAVISGAGSLMRCITANGFSCFTAPIELPLTTNSTPYSLGTSGGANNAVDLWQATDLSPTPPNFDQATRRGTVTCNGTPAVVLSGGYPFGLQWGSGSRININSVDYTISSLQDIFNLTLTTNCPSGTNLSYVAANFGALLWAKSGSTGTLSLSSLSGTVRTDYFPHGGFTGGPRATNPTAINGPNNEPGNLTIMNQGQIYWIGQNTGTARFLGTAAGQYSTNNGYSCTANSGIYDITDGGRFFCANGNGISSFKYYGDFSDAPLNQRGKSAVLNECYGSAPYTAAQPCWKRTDFTGNAQNSSLASVTSLLTSYTNGQAIQWDSRFGAIDFVGVDGYSSTAYGTGALVMRASYNNTNALAHIFVFAPYATSNSDGGSSSGSANNHGCVGGGNPGCIVASAPWWYTYSCRWCPWKDGASPSPGYVVSFVQNFLNSSPANNGGDSLQFVQVASGAADGSVSAMSSNQSTFIACPSNSYGAPTTAAPNGQCEQVTVDGEPRSDHDTTKGTLGNLRPGDMFNLGIYPTSVTNTDERAMIIARRSGSVAGTIVLTVWRGASFKGPYDTYHPGSLGSASLGTHLNLACVSSPDAGDHKAGSFATWGWVTDPHGINSDSASWPQDYNTVNDHLGFDGLGTYIQHQLSSPLIASGATGDYFVRHKGSGTYAASLSNLPDVTINTSLTFNGSNAVTNPYGDTNFQSHAGAFNTSAAPSSAYTDSGVDGRVSKGGSSSGTGISGQQYSDGGGDCPATKVSGYAYMWKFTATCMGPSIQLPYSKSYPIAAFAGWKGLVNLSGLNSVISDSTPYTFCIVAAAGECVAGSAVNETYANVPGLAFPYSYQAAQAHVPPSGYLDLSIAGSPAFRDATVQMDTSATGAGSRILTKLTGGFLSVFYSPLCGTPNGKWMCVESNYPGDGSANYQTLLIKVPPKFTSDGVNRTVFRPISVTVASRANSTAYVRFGYAENDSVRLNDHLGCTTRAEHCVAFGTSATFSSTNPYQFETTESWTGVDVSSSPATIKLPGISTRVLYYQPIWKDKTSGSLTLGGVSVAAVL